MKLETLINSALHSMSLMSKESIVEKRRVTNKYENQGCEASVMKYNSVKQSKPVILFTKPWLIKSYLLHTSLNFHLQIIFVYLFALCTWNVTDLSVSDETGKGRAVLQPLLCLWLFPNAFSSLLLHHRALEKAPTCLCSPS